MKTSIKNLKVALEMKKSKSTFNAVFLFIWVNFWHTVNFFPLEGVKKNMETDFFSVKNGISIKNLFWANLVPKMMSSLNSSGCNISIQAYYLCRFVTSSQGYQRYSGCLIYLYEKPWKMLLRSGAILHSLASFFIGSFIFSRDYNSSYLYS